MKYIVQIITFNHNKSVIIFFMILLLIGFLIGHLTGKQLIENIVLKNSRGSILLYNPANRFYSIYGSINSNNELDRLSGYYSLLENNMINETFFCERYHIEKELVVKRTIIWILGFSGDKKTVIKFFEKMYPVSDPEIKKEILSSINRLDNKYFNDFIKKNRIKENNRLP